MEMYQSQNYSSERDTCDNFRYRINFESIFSVIFDIVIAS